jgi:hypothetical protein
MRTFRCLAIVALWSARALAADYVVSPAGNDANDGSAQHPWLTLQHAADHVQPGDNVHVLAGKYVGFDLRSGGTMAKPIVFSADPGAIVNQDGPTTDGINVEAVTWVTIQGFTVNGATRNGIRGATCDHVTFRNNITDSNGVRGIFTGFCDDLLIENNSCSRSGKEHGIYVSNSAKNPTIRYNASFSNAGCGIHMNGDVSQGGSGVITNALVEDNIIFDNGATSGGSAINGDGVQNSVIQNNLLYNNHASGISLFQTDASMPSTGNLIINNTIEMASDARWCLNVQNASTGNTAFNNIFYNLHAFRGSIDLSADSVQGFVSDYNVVMDRLTPDDNNVLTLAQWQAMTGNDKHSLVATPAMLFVGNGNYHLSMNSPAIDKGTSNKAPAADLDGNARPQGNGFDIGAFESCGNNCVPAPDMAMSVGAGDMAMTIGASDMSLRPLDDMPIRGSGDLASLAGSDGSTTGNDMGGCGCTLGVRRQWPGATLFFFAAFCAGALVFRRRIRQ